MTVIRATETLRELGRADRFTGTAHLQRLLAGEEAPFLRVYRVEFAAAARTNWHYHETDQFLMVLDGECLVGYLDGRRAVLKPGDVARVQPRETHFHGAGPSGPMTHLAFAVSETKTKWLEPVTDEEFVAT